LQFKKKNTVSFIIITGTIRNSLLELHRAGLQLVRGEISPTDRHVRVSPVISSRWCEFSTGSRAASERCRHPDGLFCYLMRRRRSAAAAFMQCSGGTSGGGVALEDAITLVGRAICTTNDADQLFARASERPCRRADVSYSPFGLSGSVCCVMVLSHFTGELRYGPLRRGLGGLKRRRRGASGAEHFRIA